MKRLFRTLASNWAVIVLSLVPTLLLLVLSHRQAKSNARNAVEDRVRDGKARLDEILDAADVRLNRLIVETKLEPNEATRERLARIVYEDLRFREAGVIDPAGRLVLTDRGLLQPPFPVEAAALPSEVKPRAELLGRFRTVVMNDDSLLIARRTEAFGTADLLVQPDLLLYPNDHQDLGPTGYFGFVLAGDGRFLAGTSGMPLQNNVWVSDAADGRIRAEALSNDGRVRIVAEVSSAWALRFWWGELGYALPAVILCTLGLLALITRRLVSTGLDHDLKLGLERNEFEVHYQPVVELATGRWVGAEALLRWNHPTQGRIRPDLFIPIAEESGLIVELTRWLIRRAGVELDQVLKQKPNFYLSINLPPKLLAGGLTHALLGSVPPASALTPDRIVFELTERQLLQGDLDIAGEMHSLIALGVRFGVDDFGTGYSSLAYLHRFPFHVMKLDKSFLPAPDRSESAVVVLDTLIDLGRKLNLQLIAEGIEQAAQAEMLQQRDVKLGQGWLYCRAIPAAQFVQQVLA